MEHRSSCQCRVCLSRLLEALDTSFFTPGYLIVALWCFAAAAGGGIVWLSCRPTQNSRIRYLVASQTIDHAADGGDDIEGMISNKRHLRI